MLQGILQHFLVLEVVAEQGYDRIQDLGFTVLGHHILNAGFAAFAALCWLL